LKILPIEKVENEIENHADKKTCFVHLHTVRSTCI